MQRLVSFFGVLVILGIAYLLSNSKKKISPRIVLSGLVLQLSLALFILWTPFGVVFFESARHAVSEFLNCANIGAEFIFGANFRDHFFAFSVLPTIIFVSSFMAILFYLGILQKVVTFMAKVMVKIMNISGAESLAASANVFIGQTEAPLVIKPYLSSMTRSELMALMTGGMATISGGVMAAYASMGADPGHLLAASLMAAPGSLVIAKIMFPETEESVTKGSVKINLPIKDSNILDAACRGASEGLTLALNVAAMLIAFISLIYLLDLFLGVLPNVANEPITMQRILSVLFYPLSFIMGVDSQDIFTVAGLLGKKIVMNEFIAYSDLVSIKDQITPRSFTLTTYALCGFANLGSVAIQIGGIGGLAPDRRADFAKIGFKALVAGTLSTLLNASVAGMLMH